MYVRKINFRFSDVLSTAAQEPPHARCMVGLSHILIALEYHIAPQ
jgi:hypothetical protein